LPWPAFPSEISLRLPDLINGLHLVDGEPQHLDHVEDGFLLIQGEQPLLRNRSLIRPFFNRALEAPVAVVDGKRLGSGILVWSCPGNGRGRSQGLTRGDALVIPGHTFPIKPVIVIAAGQDQRGQE